ncbi:unnamed protein product, partial [Rotaria sp. Silwood2]
MPAKASTKKSAKSEEDPKKKEIFDKYGEEGLKVGGGSGGGGGGAGGQQLF